MFSGSHNRLTIAAVAVFATMATACETDRNPVAVDDAALTTPISAQARAHHPGAAAERYFFKAQVEPVNDARVRGIAQFEIVGGYLTAKVRVNGLAANEYIPQHIHVNPTCSPAGGVLINLDRGLTVPGEAPIVGENFPRANRGGVVIYNAQRSLESLRYAVNNSDAFDVYLASDRELIEWLDLGNRNVNFHEPLPLPIPAVGCGVINRVN